MKCEACGHENVDGARFCAGCGALAPTEEQGEDPLIGQVIGGRYRITGVLGEGGMGVVYVGEQQMGSTVRKVAVKTLHPHLSKDPSIMTRFHRECGTVAQLEHPNTIKFYDFGATSEGTLYIAMEFVKGTSLDQVIEQGGAMASDRTLKIMKQICGALDEAHKQGIVHRDLKPENIILTDRAGETDTVKVLDFGIAARSESADAKQEQKLTQQGMVLGTPPYMSPEQFTGKALDLRSDVYSLGVMAYEMLTGRLPFEADTPWQWATQHMTAQPTPIESLAPSAAVPEPMRSAIMRALSKEREQRQGSAQEFFSELSGGGGLTVDEAVPPSLASAGTAAMEAAPDFGAAAAPAAAQPPPAVAGQPMAAPTPMGAAPVMGAAVPPPPAQAAGGGIGKFLILGLLAIGGLLAVAIAVVALRTMKPEEEPEGPLINPFSSAAGEATVAPEIPTSAVADAGAAPAAVAATAVATAQPTTKKTGPVPTATGTKPPATATAPSSGKACDACISAAAAGNIQGAAANYRKCTNASKKAACSGKARRTAADAAHRAALNGNCAQARGIIAAAKGMGAGSSRLDGALSGTACK